MTEVNEKVAEVIDDIFTEYFYTNKLTEAEANGEVYCSVEHYSIGNIAEFYLLRYKDKVIASVFDDNERMIISNYSRRNDGQSNDNSDGGRVPATTH